MSDAVSILSYYITNKTFLTPYEPLHPKEFYTQSYWDDKVKHDQEIFQNDLGIKFWIFEKKFPSKVIGVANYSNIVRGVFQACYLGYSLAEEKQGRGYMTEALTLSINYIFKELHLHRIMANCMIHNKRSLAVLKRLGFVEEGVAKDYLMINGKWEDHVLTALTNQNYSSI